MDGIRVNLELRSLSNSEFAHTLNVLSKRVSELNESLVTSIQPSIFVYDSIKESINKIIVPFEEMYSNLGNEISILADAMKAISIPVFDLYSDNVSNDELDINKTKNKVITEIFQSDLEKVTDNEELPIITLSPVNDRVLKYLSEHPESFYQLTDNDFEIVMAEIYSKLGYDVTRTKATRDGGKDLIIKIPEILGDFIYYVECKKYAAKRPIGVGIIRNLVGTVNTDRVNGGILATTSFFTRNAYEFITDNKWDCQIKTHDYNVIKDLLSQVVTSI